MTERDARDILPANSEPKAKRDVFAFLRGQVVTCEGEKFLDTEGEGWKNSRLALLNAVLDTLEAGTRLTIKVNDDDEVESIDIFERFEFEERKRDLPQALRDLADSIEKLNK